MADEPARVFRGDTPTWTRAQADYPSTNGWDLAYFFGVDAAAAPTKVDATPNADGTYQVALTAAITGAFPVGTCHWMTQVSKASEVHTVGEGTIEVLPSPTEAYDRRTHAEKCLAAITAVLEKQVGDPIVEYEIDGVKAKKIPHDQLLKLRAHYKSLVNRQKNGTTLKRYPVRFWP